MYRVYAQNHDEVARRLVTVAIFYLAGAFGASARPSPSSSSATRSWPRWLADPPLRDRWRRSTSTCQADFVAAAQVLVYAGAVMILFLFVLAYLGDRGEISS